MAKYMLVNGIRVAKSFEENTSGRLSAIGPSFWLSIIEERRRRELQVFQCECGNVVAIRVSAAKDHDTRSCGCFNLEISKTNNAKHGEASRRTPEYRAWVSMRGRCFNKNDHGYARYGGRGISVCERWMGSDGYSNFLEDMGRKPSADHSIDRIDVNGDYCPENCRWATRIQQQRNTTSNHVVSHNGISKCLAEWAEDVGMNANTLHGRIISGWTIERALTEPVQS